MAYFFYGVYLAAIFTSGYLFYDGNYFYASILSLVCLVFTVLKILLLELIDINLYITTLLIREIQYVLIDHMSDSEEVVKSINMDLNTKINILYRSVGLFAKRIILLKLFGQKYAEKFSNAQLPNLELKLKFTKPRNFPRR